MDNQSGFIQAATITLFLLSFFWNGREIVNILIKCWLVGISVVGIILNLKIYHLI